MGILSHTSHCDTIFVFHSPIRVRTYNFHAICLKIILSFSVIPAEVIQSNTIVFCDFLQL